MYPLSRRPGNGVGEGGSSVFLAACLADGDPGENSVSHARGILPVMLLLVCASPFLRLAPCIWRIAKGR